MDQILAGIFCLALLAPSIFASSVKGIVLEAESRAPLEKVQVYLSGTSFEATTGIDGRFSIESVPSGQYLLVATAVGFGLVKQRLVLEEEEVTELEILLNAGTQIRNEITVAADPELLLRGSAGRRSSSSSRSSSTILSGRSSNCPVWSPATIS